MRWNIQNVSNFLKMSSNFQTRIWFRADSKCAPSQWETSLQSNAVSHWLGTNLDSALRLLPSPWPLGIHTRIKKPNVWTRRQDSQLRFSIFLKFAHFSCIGASYMPIDVSYPVPLVEDIFCDSQPVAVVVESTMVQYLPGENSTHSLRPTQNDSHFTDILD